MVPRLEDAVSANHASLFVPFCVLRIFSHECIRWLSRAYRSSLGSYYRETHAVWRAKVREFTEREISPNVGQWEEDKSLPKSLVKTMAKEGLLPATVGGEWPAEWTDAEAPEVF